jgi:hypothetical protein
MACLKPKQASMGLSKHGQPFVTCAACRARCFVKHADGLSFWQRSDPEVLARIQSDLARAQDAVARRQAEAEVRAIADAVAAS